MCSSACEWERSYMKRAGDLAGICFLKPPGLDWKKSGIVSRNGSIYLSLALWRSMPTSREASTRHATVT